MKKKCADIFKKRLRMAMGTISQRDLAKMSGLTEVTISRYLKGERIPNLTDTIVVNWSANNLAGSKNPLPLGMGSVKPRIIYIWRKILWQD